MSIYLTLVKNINYIDKRPSVYIGTKNVHLYIAYIYFRKCNLKNRMDKTT